MIKLKVPFLVQDPRTGRIKGFKPVEFLDFEEPFVLDGPVCRRIAVLDFDDATGQLIPGAPVDRSSDPATYSLKDADDHQAIDFMQVNVFATVRYTLKMFEEADAMGRKVDWAFDGPQLLVVPRAGEWANAFYERESRSLQFFYFPLDAQRKVFTALSQDIIAHETGHALLDGIAPDLYNCLTPQSLALHEAIADLTALLVGLRSRNLQARLLEQTHGSIRGRNALSAMAEEFGFERAGGRRSELRLLWNDKTLDPDDRSLDDHGEPNSVAQDGVHAMSTVLTGALYRVLARLHDDLTAERAAKTGKSLFSSSGYGLFRAREYLKRLVLRALDYLPPGEVTFADYGRAIIAADQASHPQNSVGRDELVRQLTRRHVVDHPTRLEVRTGFEAPEMADLDLDVLVESDWAAYDFANRNRAFLGIPPDVHFWVRPRLDVTKDYYPGGSDPTSIRECIFKVSWDREEPNPRHLHLAPRRQITVGTTLAIDWETRRVRARLSSQAAARPAGADEQTSTRDAMLRRLVGSGALRVGAPLSGHDAGGSRVRVESSGDLMRVRGSARLLHIAPEEV